MRFTMARPEVSCHPESLLEGARTVISAALCYYAPGPEPGVGEGRMPRYAWRDHYAVLRDRLDALGRRLGGAYRVLVDANHHVDRAGAERAGVGFIGKNTMLITRTHGSWVVLGTLVTDVELEATPTVPPGCGSCTLCIDACPTDALDEPGVLDSTRCLAYWTQTPGEMPDEVMEALEDRVYGCDICQDVCPWNRGIEKRRSGAELQHDAQPTVSLVDWLTREETDLVDELERLYVPKNEARWLRRNALVALGNVGDQEDVPVLRALHGRPGARAALDGRAGARTGRTHVRDADAISERLRILAHELRSPVAALTALAAAAEGDHDLGRRSRLVELGIAAARDIERLLTDPEHVSLRLEPVDVVELAAGFGSPTVEIRAGGVARVEGDPTRLRQALGNLVANGLRHGTLVVVDVTESDGRAVIDVSDDGPGVDAALDPFARGAGTAGSTGYGLWLSRAIAEAHGGSLELVEDSRAGTRFRLALPSASAAR